MREGSDPWGTSTRVQRRLAMTVHLVQRCRGNFGDLRSNLSNSGSAG